MIKIQGKVIKIRQRRGAAPPTPSNRMISYLHNFSPNLPKISQFYEKLKNLQFSSFFEKNSRKFSRFRMGAVPEASNNASPPSHSTGPRHFLGPGKTQHKITWVGTFGPHDCRRGVVGGSSGVQKGNANLPLTNFLQVFAHMCFRSAGIHSQEVDWIHRGQPLIPCSHLQNNFQSYYIIEF